MVLVVLLPTQPSRTEVSYTGFRQQVQAANVTEISSRGDTIQGTFGQGVARTASAQHPPPRIQVKSCVTPH
jgi:cell division protease FtsH